VEFSFTSFYWEQILDLENWWLKSVLIAALSNAIFVNISSSCPKRVFLSFYASFFGF